MQFCVTSVDKLKPGMMVVDGVGLRSSKGLRQIFKF